jgi:protein involved in polysaccharide export with SLBB domain
MRRLLDISALLFAIGLLAACGGEPAPRPLDTQREEYRLGTGDHLRVDVFGEPDLSGESDVDSTGAIPLKLGGRIDARGKTGRELEQAIEHRLAEGYVKDPHVSVSVLTYRPFYVLGEVQKPGPYPYVAGMTVAHAIAIAGGYTYRASKRSMTVMHFGDPKAEQYAVQEANPILPGDLIRVPERLF